jgi:hypothetical protein
VINQARRPAPGRKINHRKAKHGRKAQSARR